MDKKLEVRRPCGTSRVDPVADQAISHEPRILDQLYLPFVTEPLLLCLVCDALNPLLSCAALVVRTISIERLLLLFTYAGEAKKDEGLEPIGGIPSRGTSSKVAVLSLTPALSSG